jgi:hypothetical protein
VEALSRYRLNEICQGSANGTVKVYIHRSSVEALSVWKRSQEGAP